MESCSASSVRAENTPVLVRHSDPIAARIAQLVTYFEKWAGEWHASHPHAGEREVRQLMREVIPPVVSFARHEIWSNMRRDIEGLLVSEQRLLLSLSEGSPFLPKQRCIQEKLKELVPLFPNEKRYFSHASSTRLLHGFQALVNSSVGPITASSLAASSLVECLNLVRRLPEIEATESLLPCGQDRLWLLRDAYTVWKPNEKFPTDLQAQQRVMRRFQKALENDLNLCQAVGEEGAALLQNWDVVGLWSQTSRDYNGGYLRSLVGLHLSHLMKLEALHGCWGPFAFLSFHRSDSEMSKIGFGDRIKRNLILEGSVKLAALYVGETDILEQFPQDGIGVRRAEVVPFSGTVLAALEEKLDASWRSTDIAVTLLPFYFLSADHVFDTENSIRMGYRKQLRRMQYTSLPKKQEWVDWIKEQVLQHIPAMRLLVAMGIEWFSIGDWATRQAHPAFFAPKNQLPEPGKWISSQSEESTTEIYFACDSEGIEVTQLKRFLWQTAPETGESQAQTWGSFTWTTKARFPKRFFSGMTWKGEAHWDGISFGEDVTYREQAQLLSQLWREQLILERDRKSGSPRI